MDQRVSLCSQTVFVAPNTSLFYWTRNPGERQAHFLFLLQAPQHVSLTVFNLLATIHLRPSGPLSQAERQRIANPPSPVRIREGPLLLQLRVDSVVELGIISHSSARLAP